MDTTPTPPADKRPTLNGDAASPPDGPAGAFDWQRFWLCMKHPLPLEVAHVCFDQPEDAENIAQLRGCVFKDRVRFENCIFPTQVDLAESRFEQSLHMVDCTFEKGLILRNVQVRTRLSLRGSTVHDEARFWLDWRGLTTGADLSLICVTAHAPIDLYNARIGADLRLDGLHALAKGKRAHEITADGPLGIVDQHHVRNDMVGKAVNLEGAVVGRHVRAYLFGDRRTTIMGTIDLRASVTGYVILVGAVVDAGLGGRALNMTSATVGGSILFVRGTCFSGLVDLRARVAGGVEFQTAFVFAPSASWAVNMDGASVGGSVFFTEGTRISGSINLRANAKGGVEFEGAFIDAGETGHAITFESAEIGGPCLLRERTIVVGSISFLQAQLRGGLSCSRSPKQMSFDQPGSGGKAVPVQCLCVAGGIDLRFAEVYGPVMLHGIGVSGTIEARHLTVHGDLHICGGNVGMPAPLPPSTEDAPKSGGEQNASADGQKEKIDPHRARDSKQLAKWYRSLNSKYLTALSAQDTADKPTDKPEKDVEEAKNAVETFLKDFWSGGAEGKGWAAWQTEATPKDKAPTAIDLELAEVHGHLWIKGTKALGTVRLDDAEVVGEANFDRSILHGDLRLRSSDVRGDVIATKASGPEPKQGVVGTLDATGSAIGTLTLDIGATDASPEQPVIVLDGATVGNVALRGTLPSQSDATVFSAQGLNFRALNVDALRDPSHRDLSTWDWARIWAWVALVVLTVVALVAHDGTRGTPVVIGAILVYAVVTVVIAFNTLAPKRPKEAGLPILGFLDRTKWSAAPYVVIERWARASGDDTTADEIFLSRRKRELEQHRRRRLEATGRTATKNPFAGIDFHWLWHRCVLDFMFGYGVRPGRALHLFVLLWLINWAVFLPAYSVERPLSFEASANETHAAAAIQGALRRQQMANADLPNLWTGEGGKPGKADEWGAQMAFFMALRLQIPLVDLFVDKPWKPADRAMFADGTKRGGWELTYENYAAAMRALNLILVPVIIAGATGFLKPKDRGENGT